MSNVLIHLQISALAAEKLSWYYGWINGSYLCIAMTCTHQKEMKGRSIKLGSWLQKIQYTFVERTQQNFSHHGGGEAKRGERCYLPGFLLSLLSLCLGSSANGMMPPIFRMSLIFFSLALELYLLTLPEACLSNNPCHI